MISRAREFIRNELASQDPEHRLRIIDAIMALPANYRVIFMRRVQKDTPTTRALGAEYELTGTRISRIELDSIKKIQQYLYEPKKILRANKKNNGPRPKSALKWLA